MDKIFCLFSYSRAYSFAPRGFLFIDTSCYAARSVQETRQDVPSWNSLGGRANVATLSLRSYLRELLQIQRLRWRFDDKTPTRKWHASRKARIFPICDAPKFSTNFKRNGIAKTFAKLLPVQTTRRGYPASDALRRMPREFQGGKPWRVFLVRSLPRGKE